MSYILDALRKSERERQQADPLVLDPMRIDAVELPRRRLGWGGAAALLAVALLAITVYWIVARERAVITPAPTSSGTSKGESVAIASKPTPANAPTVRPAPELKPSPFITAPSRSAIRDLAREARAETKAPAAAVVPTTVTPLPPEATSTIAKASPAAAPDASNAEPIRFLRAMPSDFQRDLRDLSVTIHIYAPNPADCILYINNRQYRAGEQVREGVKVEEIVPDGAVLTYHGQRFKLPRPT